MVLYVGEAEQFAIQHCRAVDADPLERYIIYDLRDNVVAMTSLSNYYAVIRMIPDELDYDTQKEYRMAVAKRCVALVRESMATAHEFDLR